MIFNFFRKKPLLKDLIPNKFVDIHSHVLPGLDDGAKTAEESLTLISKMKELGFTKIICTPHTYSGIYDNTKKSICNSYNLIKKSFYDIELKYSSEYMLDQTIYKRIEEKSFLCLNKNQILVELSFIDKPLGLYDMIFKIQNAGYEIILAHPERYFFFHNNFNDYKKLKKHGVKFQINLLSCVNYYGKKVTEICDKLFKYDFVDFVGSDIHNQNHINQFEKKIEIVNIKKLKSAIENNIDFFG